MTEPAAPATPAATQTPASATPTLDPVAPKPGDVGTPEWLNPRLEQAKRAERAAVLKDLGVDDLVAAKKALDESKARADAEKTASERLEAEKKAREKAEKELADARTALSARADAELASLSPAQQAFVEKTAGSDPARRLATIADVRSLVASSAPASAPPAKDEPKPTAPEAKPEAKPTAPAPEPKKPLPAPASTAAPGAAPAGGPPAPVDHLAVLEQLDRVNPIAAGAYYAKHKQAIQVARAQKTSGTPAST